MGRLEQGTHGFDDGRTHCQGCGAELQSVDRSKPGYIPEKALQQEKTICMRCFRIKHYNEVSKVTIQADDFLELLSRIGESERLILHIVDVFDFEGSLISGLPRFVHDNPILLVVNKFDLLPKKTNPNRILNWVRRQLKQEGMKVNDVVILSAKRNIGFDKLLERINEYRGDHDVAVIGATNTGKSTLINRLIRSRSDLDMEITTSRFPGTTLDEIRIPLDDGRYLIDTPGIVYDYRLTECMPDRHLQTIIPEHTIRPRVYQLNEEQTLFFGACARMDFIRGERQSFTCYVSNSLQMHRTKLANADELYARHKGEMLQPPLREELEMFPPLFKHTFRIQPGEKMDVAISGLGWIQVNGTTGALLDVYAPKGIKVVLRPSILG